MSNPATTWVSAGTPAAEHAALAPTAVRASSSWKSGGAHLLSHGFHPYHHHRYWPYYYGHGWEADKLTPEQALQKAEEAKRLWVGWRAGGSPKGQRRGADCAPEGAGPPGGDAGCQSAAPPGEGGEPGGQESQVTVLGQGSYRWAEIADHVQRRRGGLGERRGQEEMERTADRIAAETLERGWSGTPEQRAQQTGVLPHFWHGNWDRYDQIYYHDKMYHYGYEQYLGSPAQRIAHSAIGPATIAPSRLVSSASWKQH